MLLARAPVQQKTRPTETSGRMQERGEGDARSAHVRGTTSRADVTPYARLISIRSTLFSLLLRASGRSCRVAPCCCCTESRHGSVVPNSRSAFARTRGHRPKDKQDPPRRGAACQRPPLRRSEVLLSLHRSYLCPLLAGENLLVVHAWRRSCTAPTAAARASPKGRPPPRRPPPSPTPAAVRRAPHASHRTAPTRSDTHAPRKFKG